MAGRSGPGGVPQVVERGALAGERWLLIGEGAVPEYPDADTHDLPLVIEEFLLVPPK